MGFFMLNVRTLKQLWVAVIWVLVGSLLAAIWSNNRLMDRAVSAQPTSHVARDLWIEAARMGAPVFRGNGGPVSLSVAPVGKSIVLSGVGYVFATDDVAEVARWYGLLTYPMLDLTGFPEVRYVYEVESAEIVREGERSVLAITVHEARTGCERPVCDPVTQLPNYDRRYVVKPTNASVSLAGGKHA